MQLTIHSRKRTKSSWHYFFVRDAWSKLFGTKSVIATDHFLVDTGLTMKRLGKGGQKPWYPPNRSCHQKKTDLYSESLTVRSWKVAETQKESKQSDSTIHGLQGRQVQLRGCFLYNTPVMEFNENTTTSQLGGGWHHPLEKYARQIGSSPQVRVTVKNS